VRDWVGQADIDAGNRSDGLTTAEREELAAMRRENRRLREDAEEGESSPDNAGTCQPVLPDGAGPASETYVLQKDTDSNLRFAQTRSNPFDATDSYCRRPNRFRSPASSDVRRDARTTT